MARRAWSFGLTFIVIGAPIPLPQSAPKPEPQVTPAAPARDVAPAGVALEFVTDEADAVLALVGRRGSDPGRSDPPRVRTLFHWIGAFGEGYAMLAAAGGPDVHPHATSGAEERARWDHDVARCDADLAELESFFVDILEGRLTDAARIDARAASYYGVQGPWYTVGWKMAVTIERALGRERLLECTADPRRLLATYDDAVDELATPGVKPPATWSASLLNALEPK